MKNYLILAMILMAGMTAYPQATRSARETKSDKGSERKETQRSVNRSESKSNRTATIERSKSGAVKSEATRSRVESRGQERPAVNRSSNTTSRSRVESRSTNEPVRKSQESTRVRTTPERREVSSGAERRVQTTTRPDVKSGNQVRRETTTATRPDVKSGSTRTVRESGRDDDRDVRVNTSSASRIYREGKGSLTREDGTTIRHQNDDVFKSHKYRLDFDNYENLRRSDDFRRHYRDYDNWYHHRHVRVVHHYHNRYIPVPYEVRRARYYYRAPHHIDLIWTPLLFHRFMYYYPTHRNWEMEFGSRIETISAYEAQDWAGTVRRVYGKVDEVYYSPEDENYILYIGAPFPYHDLSVVIPRHIARDISMSPKWYFENEYVWVVGLINMWEGKPEIIVRDEDQVRRY